MPHKPPKDRDILALLEMKPGYILFRCPCRTRYLVYVAPEELSEENARKRAKRSGPVMEIQRGLTCLFVGVGS